MPTAGGLYWWTHYFAGDKYKNPLSFLIGYTNTLGLIGGICSVDYTLALMILSCVSIVGESDWTPSRGEIYAVYVALILIHGVSAVVTGRIMPKIQTACIYINIGLVIATVIALPVGKVARGGSLNSGKYVFGHVDNQTGWPTGWGFMLSWLAPIWSIGSFDSCVHMSEEALHAAKAVPMGIMFSAGSALVFGFLVLSVMAATMNPDVSQTLSTKFGQPMAQVGTHLSFNFWSEEANSLQIYYDAIGKDGALGFMIVLCIVQYLIGLSLLVATSRQAWAFSRDGAFPFSNFFRHISKRIQYQPIRMICGLIVVCLILGLLCLINNAATNALFSLFVASNYLSWGMPIFCRVFWGESRFQPGEFYTGRFSKPIAWVAVVYLLFGVVLSMFPTAGPNPSPPDMNYTVVINAFVWIGCMVYYFLFAKHWFTGPRMTVDEGSSIGSESTPVTSVLNSSRTPKEE
ncbi:GABA-specific high-affinity permease [Penicillium ochrochloron]